MKAEAATAGLCGPEHFSGQGMPRAQILAIAQLLEDKQVLYPRVAPGETFARAAKQKKESGTKQASLKVWPAAGPVGIWSLALSHAFLLANSR